MIFDKLENTSYQLDCIQNLAQYRKGNSPLFKEKGVDYDENADPKFLGIFIKDEIFKNFNEFLNKLAEINIRLKVSVELNRKGDTRIKIILKEALRK